MRLLDYEQLGTSALSDAIAKTSKLKAFINSGDKEPSYDGYIYIYNNKKYKKGNLKKVSIQVKAKGVSGKFNSIIKYPISVIDLNNYLHNGGVMYFVVYINSNTPDKKQIYYASLLPFKISELLKNKPDNKKTINVQFRCFPTNEDEITDLFLNFHSDAQKQISFIGKELPTIKDLQKQGKLESLTLSYISTKGNGAISSYPKMLDGKEVYLYANVKGGIAPIPVECYTQMTKLQMSCTDDVSVSVNGKVYYTKMGKTITADKIIHHLGSSVTITVPNKTDAVDKKSDFTVVITIKLKGSLKERINALEFLIAMFEAKHFELDGVEFPADFAESELKKLNPSSYPETLSGYKRALSVLEKLNVKKDLDIEKFSKDDFWKLNSLIGAIEDGAPISNVKGDLPSIVNIKFGGLFLVMLCEKVKNGEYKVWDYFDKHIDVCVFDKDKKPIPASQYSVMKADDFLRVDNLRLQKVVDDFKSIKPQQFIIENGNVIMLEMLKAYDKKPNDELLDAINQMFVWLKTANQYLSDEILQLNEFQIIKRTRELNFQEKQLLSKIATSSDDVSCKVGAFLLLDEQDEAEKLLQEMPKEVKEDFMTYPIFRFYTKSKEDNKNG